MPSQPLFHQVFDGQRFWGLNFYDKSKAKSFEKAVAKAIKDSMKSFEPTLKKSKSTHIETRKSITPTKTVQKTSQTPPNKSTYQNNTISTPQTKGVMHNELNSKTTSSAPSKLRKSSITSVSPLKITPSPAPPKVTPQPLSPVSDKSHREKIIDEILKTESDYVDSLNILSTMYYYPLKYSPRMGLVIFRPGDFEKIFYGFETIRLLNKELLQELKNSVASKTLYNSCGKVLNMFAPSMKLYIDYVNNYGNTIKLIKDYEKSNENFKKFLQSNMEDVDCQLRGIQDFLIMPIQRVPRYVLLLQQLKGKTEQSHPDYSNITSALTTLESIATYINNQKKDYDNKEKVALIQQRMNPKTMPLMKEGRYQIMEGIVYVKNEEFIPPKKPIKKKEGKPLPAPEILGLKAIELFLMNDLILWAEKDVKYNYLNEICRVDLWDIVDCDTVENWEVPFYPLEESQYRSFTLKSHSRDVDIPTFYVLQPTEHASWLSTIKEKFPEAADRKAKELDRKVKAIKTV